MEITPLLSVAKEYGDYPITLRCQGLWSLAHDSVASEFGLEITPLLSVAKEYGA